MGVSSGKRHSTNRLRYSQTDLRIRMPDWALIKNLERVRVYRLNGVTVSIPQMFFDTPESPMLTAWASNQFECRLHNGQRGSNYLVTANELLEMVRKEKHARKQTASVKIDI